MSRQPDEQSKAKLTWVVDCPRHGRAKVVLDHLGEGLPDVSACDVFPDGLSPPCEKACLQEFDLKPRSLTIAERADDEDSTEPVDLPSET